MSTMNHRVNEDGGPWFKQFWAWFVFTPLLVVIVASLSMVFIAFSGKDDVVVDDYYKVGKMINQEFEPSARAKALGLVATFSLVEATAPSLKKLVEVSLNDTEWLVQESLLLNLSHPIDAEKDHFITLRQVDDLRWRAEAKSALSGRWYLRVSALDDAGGEQWRIQGEVDFSKSKGAQLQ